MFAQKTGHIVNSLAVDTWTVDVCQKTECIVSRLVVDNWRVGVCQ